MDADAIFAVNPQLDVGRLADRLEREQRVQIDDFLLPRCAHKLRDELHRSPLWRHVINGTERVYEIASDEFDALDPAVRIEIERATHAAAATGFQFSFDTIRVSDDETERRRSLHLTDAFARFMMGDEMLDLLSQITRNSEVCFVDAQATRYRAGDFLTRHDDMVDGKYRSHAYVLNLVDGWRAEWGGLLLFLDEHGGVLETYVPRFNTLNLFAVGQPHAVSFVAPYAAADRIAVTGWLRRRR